MEGYADLVFSPHGDDALVDRGERGCTLVDFGDVGRADKRHGNVALDARKRCFRVEAAQLTPVGVSPHGYGQRAESARRDVSSDHFRRRVARGRNALFDGLREQDEPRAGAHDGHAVRNAAVQLVDHAELAQELCLHRALAARQHKRVERLADVGPLPQLHAFASQLRKRTFVFDKRPLNSQDGNYLSHMQTFQAISTFEWSAYLPRSAMSRAISFSLIPTIASPRSSDSSAMSLASV